MHTIVELICFEIGFSSKEGNVLFNNTFNTFYYGYMAFDIR